MAKDPYPTGVQLDALLLDMCKAGIFHAAADFFFEVRVQLSTGLSMSIAAEMMQSPSEGTFSIRPITRYAGRTAGSRAS